MSFRGGGRGGNRGFGRSENRGFGRSENRGFGKSGFKKDGVDQSNYKKFNKSSGYERKKGGRNFDQGPPEEIEEFGKFSHECEGQIIVNIIIEKKVPFFNAIIYLKNIEPIGKVDEIFGRLNECSVSIQLNDNFKSSSFQKDQILYIDPKKLLPLERFLSKPVIASEGNLKKRKTNRDDKNNFKKFKCNSGEAHGNKYQTKSGGRGFSNNKRVNRNHKFDNRGGIRGRGRGRF